MRDYSVHYIINKVDLTSLDDLYHKVEMEIKGINETLKYASWDYRLQHLNDVRKEIKSLYKLEIDDDNRIAKRSIFDGVGTLLERYFNIASRSSLKGVIKELRSSEFRQDTI